MFIFLHVSQKWFLTSECFGISPNKLVAFKNKIELKLDLPQ